MGSASGRGRGLAKGQGQGQGKGSKKRGKGQGKDQGDPEGARPGGDPAEDSKLKGGETAGLHLKDASPEEREAWGRINDRHVAKSLRELWDKIPQSYRLMVTQYFRDISEPESEAAK